VACHHRGWVGLQNPTFNVDDTIICFALAILAKAGDGFEVGYQAYGKPV